jgi:hypothetical protein
MACPDLIFDAAIAPEEALPQPSRLSKAGHNERL